MTYCHHATVDPTDDLAFLRASVPRRGAAVPNAEVIAEVLAAEPPSNDPANLTRPAGVPPPASRASASTTV